MKKHKTGYYVWIGGDRHWHRTYRAAQRRAAEAQSQYGSAIVQIDDARSGKRVYGDPEQAAANQSYDELEVERGAIS